MLRHIVLSNFYAEYEEEIERWKALYEEQSIREQELTKNKYQVLAFGSHQVLSIFKEKSFCLLLNAVSWLPCGN